MVKQFHFKSRNEFFAEAVEYYIADYLLGSNESAVSDKLGKAIAKYSEDNAKAISKGLFRYAVQLEMMCRVLAATNGIDKDWLELDMFQNLWYSLLLRRWYNARKKT